jgi:tRNA modification GTPase
MDTIFALSSGGLPSGVAVIRISGPACGSAVDALVGQRPAPRVATLRALRDEAGGVLDRGLVLWFPAPASFTGEDVAELQVHGGRATVSAVLERLGRMAGLRSAGQGEFTRRALAAGRFDLTQIEGLSDLLAAETEAQRRQALRQADGELRRFYERWRSEMIAIRGLVEAHFDFGDEEDVPGDAVDVAWQRARGLRDEIRRHLDDGRRGERVRSGIEVVLMGAPNSGKSSLVNRLAGREAAIVTAEAGTTRDPIEVHLDLGGVAVAVVDTAGVREGAVGAIEAEGIRRARQRGEGADLVLWLTAPDIDDEAKEPPSGVPVWRVATKSDIRRGPEERSAGSGFDHRVSAKTGEGVDRLVAALAGFVGGVSAGNRLGPTRARHRRELEGVVSDLEEGIARRDIPLEIRAESLRAASDGLGRLTGAIGVEDLLDRIFREFCIGK